MVKGRVFKIDTEILEDKETGGCHQEDLPLTEIELGLTIMILGETIEPDLNPAIEIGL